MSRRTAWAVRLALLVSLVAGCSAADQPLTQTAGQSDQPAANTSASGPTEPASTPAAPDPDSGTPTPPPTPSKAPTPSPTARPKTGPFGTMRLTGTKAVALTFDDGPHPTWTPKLLDLLKAQKIKATFCLVGQNVRKYPALVARIVREGHALCNHSWEHDLELGKKPEAQIRADIEHTNQEIRRAVPGAKIPYYRQPGGKWTPSVVKVAKDLGMKPLHWDVDPQDWAKPGAAKISQRVATQIRAGSIVLMHDGGGDRSGTLTASPEIIEALRKQYGIVRLK
jgi:peptidoglycan/xylan/chitin deacetylase (PgdA/CDA1 family)